jgi:acyl carrier protein
LSSAETLDRLLRAFVDASITLDSNLVFEPDLAFDEIDGLDSVSRVRLTMAIEDAFSIEISPRENSKLKTIGDLVNLIESKQRGG